MSTRDDFPARVRRAVALRAGYLCSFTDCARLTVGPSDESPTASANVGIAAHIHAAAPGEGARRYLASMLPAERAHIDNAIWMCATHAALIDRDEATYSADVLRRMKADHERAIAIQIAGTSQVGGTTLTLLALGPDIVAAGEVIGTAGLDWTVRLDHFVRGDVETLIQFGEKFDSLPRDERFVLVNALGDGRVLEKAPTWRKDGGAIVVNATVQTRFPRDSAKDLGTDLKIADGDLIEVDGDLATVSGIEALPQKIQLCLWHQKSDTPFARRFGSRIGEYYTLFGQSAWFEQLVKLEMIRLASVPYQDIYDEYTPFNCVERVCSAMLVGPGSDARWLIVRVQLEVNGLGNWSHDITLFVPPS